MSAVTPTASCTPPIHTTVCDCGHKAMQHHGIDGRESPDAGCMANGMLRADWCHCARTCMDVVMKFGTRWVPVTSEDTCGSCGRILDCCNNCPKGCDR